MLYYWSSFIASIVCFYIFLLAFTKWLKFSQFLCNWWLETSNFRTTLIQLRFIMLYSHSDRTVLIKFSRTWNVNFILIDFEIRSSCREFRLFFFHRSLQYTFTEKVGRSLEELFLLCWFLDWNVLLLLNLFWIQNSIDYILYNCVNRLFICLVLNDIYDFWLFEYTFDWFYAWINVHLYWGLLNYLLIIWRFNNISILTNLDGFKGTFSNWICLFLLTLESHVHLCR